MTVCYPPRPTPAHITAYANIAADGHPDADKHTNRHAAASEEVVPFLAPLGDEVQQANGLAGGGEPTVIALAEQRLLEAATPSPTPVQPQAWLAFLNDRPLTDALATIGVLIGGLALIGMLTWLIIWNRRRRG